jgi:hypothetical protein
MSPPLSPEEKQRALVALGKSIMSALADRRFSAAERDEWINQQVADYRVYIGAGDDVRKGMVTDMDIGSISAANAVALAKRSLDSGVPILKRADCTREIDKIADLIRRPGETIEKARVRARYEHPDGRLLHKVGELAGGPDHEPPPKVEPPVPELGPAARRMQALADDHRKANPRKTPEGAYAAVYTAPENAELRRECLNEHLMRVAKAS